MREADQMTSPADGVQPATTGAAAAHWRKSAGSAVLWVGCGIGAAVALLYEILMCTAPPPDWSQMHFRTLVNAYVMAPIVIFGGIVWLCSWIARRIDPARPLD
jgi:hypothetical protein